VKWKRDESSEESGVKWSGREMRAVRRDESCEESGVEWKRDESCELRERERSACERQRMVRVSRNRGLLSNINRLEEIKMLVVRSRSLS
jgi:hypothetical protein